MPAYDTVRDQIRVRDYYEDYDERSRLTNGAGLLEFARLQEIIGRYAAPPPAVVLDVGGGPGRYSCWLARLGYEVHLIDLTPRHLEQAREASASQPDHPLTSVSEGDARSLAWDDESIGQSYLEVLPPACYLRCPGSSRSALPCLRNREARS